MMKKKKILALSMIGLLLFTAVLYLLGFLYFSRHFLPHTTLNGVETAFLNQEETEKMLAIMPVKLQVIEKDANGTDTVKEDLVLLNSDGIDLHYEIGEISGYQEALTWFLDLFKEKELNCRQISGSYDKEKLKGLLDDLYCMRKDNQHMPIDAHLELTKEGLKLVEAEDGSYIDPDLVRQMIENALDQALQGEELNEIDLLPAYAAAQNTETEDLKNKISSLQKILDKKIHITIAEDQSVTLQGSELQELLMMQDNELQIEDGKLESYANSLVDRYSISSNEYIVKSSLKDSLRNSLLRDTDSSIECQWVRQTVQRSSSLIEVSYSQQKLYYYENGELIFTSDVVTGNEDTEIISYGTYYVQHMKRNATLVSSTYTEHVDYWIGFDYESGGHVLGFHDASWRNAFGGDIWRSDPSHGCINMPTDKVAMLYEAVDIGTEIYIHE